MRERSFEMLQHPPEAKAGPAHWSDWSTQNRPVDVERKGMSSHALHADSAIKRGAGLQ